MSTYDAPQAVAPEPHTSSSDLSRQQTSSLVIKPSQQAAVLAAEAITQQNTYQDPNSELVPPTAEELQTLRRVPNRIPLKVFLIAFVELFERFSYYGSAFAFTKFIEYPLPEGSITGADPGPSSLQPGALGMGQRASIGITTFNQFWHYIMPLFGAYIADVYWGRYRTINIALGVDIIGHFVLVFSALPPVIPNREGSMAAMILGIIVIGIGTGGFKPNVNAFIAEQLGEQHLHAKTLNSGERVIVDPAVTTERIYNWFYFFANIGTFVAFFAMPRILYYNGFWLVFTLSTAVFCICPVVMIWGRRRYARREPGGPVLSPALKIFFLAQKGRWSFNPLQTYRNMHDGTFWSAVKPSNFTPETRPKWMTFDDAWVDELSRGFNACAVFCWCPLFWLCYNQTTSNLGHQASTMTIYDVPINLIQNLNPLAVLIVIPLNDPIIYPILRKMGIRFTPIKKITCGFYAGCAAMIWSAVVQYYIYQTSECGWYASGNIVGADGILKTCHQAPINVWAQTGSYVLIALAEVFVLVASHEYAYSKAPKNMRSMVQAFSLFMYAFAAALGQALTGLSAAPLLVWNYTVVAILAFVGGTCFHLQFRHLDVKEDELNELPEGLVANKMTDAEVPKMASRAVPEMTSNAVSEMRSHAVPELASNAVSEMPSHAVTTTTTTRYEMM